jgi:hypothetical protein
LNSNIIINDLCIYDDDLLLFIETNEIIEKKYHNIADKPFFIIIKYFFILPKN